MRLILMGPPGAGKGTQASVVAQHFGVPAISTGDIFRANVSEGTDLGRKAQEYMDAGEYVPDEITNEMVRNRIGEADATSGFLLDGYPRNLAQADALDKLLGRIQQPMDYAVQLEVPTEMLVERIAGRAKAEGRADDSPESVRTRLKVYDDQTAPVIEFYRQHGQLTVVDGVGSLDEVFTRIVEAIAPEKAVG